MYKYTKYLQIDKLVVISLNTCKSTKPLCIIAARHPTASNHVMRASGRAYPASATSLHCLSHSAFIAVDRSSLLLSPFCFINLPRSMRLSPSRFFIPTHPNLPSCLSRRHHHINHRLDPPLLSCCCCRRHHRTPLPLPPSPLMALRFDRPQIMIQTPKLFIPPPSLQT